MKKPVKMQHIVNWFFGNYCTRKCHNDEKRQREHYPKLTILAKKLDNLEMTHKEFISLLRSDKTICDLSDKEWNSRKGFWKSHNCIICKKFGLG